MVARFFDLRVFAFLFLLAALVWLVFGAQSPVMRAAPGYGKTIYAPGMSLHPQGDSTVPRNDCGDNYFLFVRLPGDLCMHNSASDARVTQEMEKIDPTINDTPIGEQPLGHWERVLYQALKNLGWDIP